MKKILGSLFVLGLFVFSFQADAAIPKVTVTATPLTVSTGGTSTIKWTSENVADCDLVGMQERGGDGSYQTEKLSKDTTYTVDCVVTGGVSIKGSVTVKVTGPASIVVLSPNASSTYSAGQKVTVKWKSTNISKSEKVSIELVNLVNTKNANNSGGVSTLVASTLNDGSESITLSSSLPAGTYKIKVKGDNANDMSDKAFTIKATTVKTSLVLLSPKRGQIFKTGDKVTVKWQSKGFASDQMMYLELGIKDLKGIITSIYSFDDIENDGSEIITIPSDAKASSSYVFSLSVDSNNKIQTVKSGVFTIGPKNPVVTVTSPNDDGDTITAKQKIDIKWSSNLDPASYVNVYVSDGKHKGHVARAKNTGVFSYTLDKVLIPGTGYKAYVSSVSNKLVTDSSDEAFSISE